MGVVSVHLKLLLARAACFLGILEKVPLSLACETFVSFSIPCRFSVTGNQLKMLEVSLTDLIVKLGLTGLTVQLVQLV